MRALLREPVIHFAVMGVVIFALHSLIAESSPDEDESIHITRSDIQTLVQTFEMTWRRAPTQDELQRLIDERVLEEVYYREALELGLDVDDTIIRRRLRQKMEFLVHDLALPRHPSESLLRRYFDAHREDFRTEPRFSFEQVFFIGGAEPERAAARAAALRDAHAAGGDVPADAGDRIALERSHDEMERARVAATFGQSFADALAELEPGRWHAPVHSGYGVHVVRVTAHQPGHVPEYPDIADAVKREWEHSEREAANQRVEQELMSRHEIRVDLPYSNGSPAALGHE